MKPLHHHLYQIIKRACEVYGKCTFAKTTFCRITGYSTGSVKKIREAMPVLEEVGLVDVKRKQKGWTITLRNDHEDVYTAILNKECKGALDAADEEEKQEIKIDLKLEEVRAMEEAFKDFQL